MHGQALLWNRCGKRKAVEPVAAADDEGTLAHLWHADMMRREEVVVDAVAPRTQAMFNRLGLASPVADKIRNVLNDEVARLVSSQDADDVVDQVAPLRTLESPLIARL